MMVIILDINCRGWIVVGGWYVVIGGVGVYSYYVMGFWC